MACSAVGSVRLSKHRATRDKLLPPPPKPAAPFPPGDRLSVRSGPLTGPNGLYAGMAPHERILVLLHMLGGERTVELARGDVLKIGTGIGTGRLRRRSAALSEKTARPR